MKRAMTSCLAMALGMVAASGTAMAGGGPAYDVIVSGSHVLVRAYTDATRWRCSYSVTAQFTDGTSSNYGGQTDPVSNAQPVTAADINFGRPVRAANVTVWDCSIIG